MREVRVRDALHALSSASTVSDTGEGIEQDKLELDLPAVLQADTSTSRKYGGTGLGLAISRQLVALMGGDCGASSLPGSGSDVLVHDLRSSGRGGLPARRGVARRRHQDGPAEPAVVDNAVLTHRSRSTAEPFRRRPPSVGQEGPSGRILLAEDNVVNQQVATSMLEHLGFLVDVVATERRRFKQRRLTPYQADPHGLPDADPGRVRGDDRDPAPAGRARLAFPSSRSPRRP